MHEGTKQALAKLQAKMAAVRDLDPEIAAAADAVAAGLGSLYHVSVESASASPSVTLYVQFWRDPAEECKPLLRWLAERGMHLEGKRDIPRHRAQEWTVGKLTLWVGFGEWAKCRFVQVGTRQEPVYEFQCEGETS